MIRSTIVFGLVVVLGGCAAGMDVGVGLDADSFGAFDTNRDALLDEREFGVGFENAGVFDTFDDDDSGFIETDEFDRDFGDFGVFDEDDDNLLTEDEFNAGLFDTFDTDDDAFVNEAEFGVGISLF